MSEEDQMVPEMGPESEEEVGPQAVALYMTSFTRYDAITGRILYTGNCTNTELEVHRMHGPALEVESNVRDDYVDLTGAEPVLKKRPSMGLVLPSLNVAANGNTPLVIGNVPANTFVRVMGPVDMDGVTTGEDVELVFAVKGAYVAYLSNFPHIDERLEINAT